MKVLVTGADGFVGSRLVSKLAGLGNEVGAAVLPGTPSQSCAQRRVSLPDGALIRDLDLRESNSVDSLVESGWEVVVHLAAASSGAEANRDPVAAWEVNVLGTVRLCQAMSRLKPGGADPLLLFVSTAEVYGAGDRNARVETDDVLPCSPYAASKLAAETAVWEAFRRTELRAIVARPFPHTGAGQDDRFVIPAFTKRVLQAKLDRQPSISVGNLDPVRDFLHVDDVVEAYCLIIDSGTVGEVYNVASGSGISVRDILEKVMSAAEYEVTPEVDLKLARPVDVPFLVGNSTKLNGATGWRPKRTLDQAIREVVDAQTD
jgi:GDP-4-dehydro-6-deoxy-D-mannose reductase